MKGFKESGKYHPLCFHGRIGQTGKPSENAVSLIRPSGEVDDNSVINIPAVTFYIHDPILLEELKESKGHAVTIYCKCWVGKPKASEKEVGGKKEKLSYLNINGEVYHQNQVYINPIVVA